MLIWRVTPLVEWPLEVLLWLRTATEILILFVSSLDVSNLPSRRVP